MPQSRHRKVNKARKRPRVPHANPGAAPETPTNQKLRVGAIILVVLDSLLTLLDASQAFTDQPS